MDEKINELKQDIQQDIQRLEELRKQSYKRESLYQTISAVITIMFAVASIYVALYFTRSKQPVFDVITISSTPYVEKNLMNSKVLISDFSNTVKDGKPTATSTAYISVTGKVSGGYLYVVANAGGKALQTSDPTHFDDVYANLIQLTSIGSTESHSHGGHLVESASLPTPASSEKTELLYPLNSVAYIDSYKDTDGKLIGSNDIKYANWLAILNDTNHNTQLEAYSSTQKEGTIEKLIIYYTCAEGSNCSISTSK